MGNTTNVCRAKLAAWLLSGKLEAQRYTQADTNISTNNSKAANNDLGNLREQNKHQR